MGGRKGGIGGGRGVRKKCAREKADRKCVAVAATQQILVFSAESSFQGKEECLFSGSSFQ